MSFTRSRSPHRPSTASVLQHYDDVQELLTLVGVDRGADEFVEVEDAEGVTVGQNICGSAS